MKKKLPILVITLLFSSQIVTGQKKTSLLETIIQEVEERIVPERPKSKTPTIINNNTKKPQVASGGDNAVIKIPVVFHVVVKGIDKTNINSNHFQKAIQYLNLGFNNINSNMIDINYRSIIGSANIQFDFASNILGCPKNLDVTYHETNKDFFKKYNADNNGHVFYDFELKKNGYLDSKTVVNIWICQLEKKNGWWI